MKIYNTKVGTTAYYKNRSWSHRTVLFVPSDNIDYKYARIQNESEIEVERSSLEDGSMLTCISKPFGSERGQSVWMVTDPHSDHFGKQAIFNGPWYDRHPGADGRIYGSPSPTHYNLMESK